MLGPPVKTEPWSCSVAVCISLHPSASQLVPAVCPGRSRGSPTQREMAVLFVYHTARGLPPWLSGKESACKCRRCGFEPWDGKIP